MRYICKIICNRNIRLETRIFWLSRVYCRLETQIFRSSRVYRQLWVSHPYPYPENSVAHIWKEGKTGSLRYISKSNSKFRVGLVSLTQPFHHEIAINHRIHLLFDSLRLFCLILKYSFRFDAVSNKNRFSRVYCQLWVSRPYPYLYPMKFSMIVIMFDNRSWSLHHYW